MNAIERVIKKWRSDAKKLWNNGHNGEACGTTDCADELERLNREVIEPIVVALDDARKVVRGRHSTISYGPQELVDRIDAALARYREDATNEAVSRMPELPR